MKIRLLINGHHYHAIVSGAGSPILLLHGFTGDVSAWQNLRPAMEKSHRVIALDILGHGKSAKPPSASSYRIERVAADVIAWLDRLSVGKIHLLGYSMGGRLALYLALRYADRFHSLILESASPGLHSQQARARNVSAAIISWPTRLKPKASSGLSISGKTCLCGIRKTRL